MKLRIFCDFDGTVALNDVGNLLFTSFGNADHWWNLVEEWRERRMNARELWRAQAAVSRIFRILSPFAASTVFPYV
jgi:2-hydroxy-3-keto-5-methylthiopentenyl-1-phosphate phosphatase